MARLTREQRKAERILEREIVLKAIQLVRDEALLTMSPRRFEILARRMTKCI